MSKVSFCLMGEKGLHSLTKTIEIFGSKVIEWVVSSKDEKIKKDYYDEIKHCCALNSIPFYEKKELSNLKTEILIAISWRWIISDSICKSLIILHDSLLPKYRGFAPLVNQLINGEKEIGVTALFANDKYDRGDIIIQKSIPISYPITIEKAIGLISPIYFDLLKFMISKIISKAELSAEKQNEENASYSLWRDEKDYKINWDDDSEKVSRFINAVGYPYSGAYSFVENNKIMINEAMPVPDLIIENRTPGKVIFFDETLPIVVCGKGLLKIISASYFDKKKEFIPTSKFRIRFL